MLQYLCSFKKAVQGITVSPPFDHDIASLPQCSPKERYFAKFLFCHKSEVQLHGAKQQRYVGHAGMVADDEIVLIGAVIFLADNFDGYSKESGAEASPPCGNFIKAVACGVEEGKQKDHQYPEKHDRDQDKKEYQCSEVHSVLRKRVTGRAH